MAYRVWLAVNGHVCVNVEGDRNDKEAKKIANGVVGEMDFGDLQYGISWDALRCEDDGNVFVAVNGCIYVDVDNANNEEDASDIACDEVCEMDFGELKDISWGAVSAEYEDENVLPF